MDHKIIWLKVNTHLWRDIRIQAFKARFKGTNYMHEGVCIQIQNKYDVAAEQNLQECKVGLR